MTFSFLALFFGCQFGGYQNGGTAPVPKDIPSTDIEPIDTAHVDDSGVDTAESDTAQTDTAEDHSDTSITDTAQDTAIDSAEPTVDSPIGALATDFQLPDQNPFSHLYQSQISPRDYMNHISGWYFIKAT